LTDFTETWISCQRSLFDCTA